MRKTIYFAALAGAFIVSGAASAAGNNKSGPTVGDCISDGFYGNEPNIVGPFAPGGPAEQEPGTKGGRVVASQSPGPKVTNPDGSVRPGASVGDVNQQFGGGALPAFCRTVTNTPS
jgi:hypothetical protein